jgi:membrane associated rhomboid family serine protease
MLPLNDPDIPRHRFPFATYAIIALNFMVFIYMLTLGSDMSDIFIYQYGFIPRELIQGVSITTAVLSDDSSISFTAWAPSWLTLFSAMFIHAGWLHILGNMLYLWVFGDNVEDRLGNIWFVFFYLASGLAAVFLQIFMDPVSDIPYVGASGAIAGVLGAYLVLYPGSRVRTLLIITIFPLIVKIPAVALLLIWFVLQFVSGIGSLGAAEAGGVAYFAHVGGFIFGMAVAGLVRMSSRPRLTGSS